MPEVIARVSRTVVQLPYGERRLEFDFPGDVLYAVSVPDDPNLVTKSGDKVVFTSNGIRHILKELSVILYLDADNTDF